MQSSVHMNHILRGKGLNYLGYFWVLSMLSGGGGVYGSGTMMLIAVVAAVITGTAVAFLIIFVRKW